MCNNAYVCVLVCNLGVVWADCCSLQRVCMRSLTSPTRTQRSVNNHHLEEKKTQLWYSIKTALTHEGVHVYGVITLLTSGLKLI